MEFDVIIIGGGLAGLTAGLRLQEKGKKTAVVSAGQNALHFSSGTFGILERLPDGTPVDDPVASASRLPDGHPYRKIGAARLEALAGEVTGFFGKAGIPLDGNPRKNGYRLTPMGGMKAAALSFGDMPLLPSPDALSGRKVLIVNLLGFMDFNTAFLANGLEKQGCTCRIENLRLPELERLRTNPSEMRSVNIARVMDASWIKAADEVKGLLKDEDLVILPQVFGLKDASIPGLIRNALPVEVYFGGTIPPSVPGIRTQMRLKDAYVRRGGTFFAGDVVSDVEWDGNRILSVTTANLGRIGAEGFILATGSYFSKGMASDMQAISNPVFGLDVLQDEGRGNWYDPDFFRPQAFMDYGVRTDDGFRPLKDGQPVANLRAAGSVLGGSRALELGCGAGVAIFTALAAADSM